MFNLHEQSAFVHAEVYKHVYTAEPPVAEAASILLNYNMVWYHKRDAYKKNNTDKI